VAKHVRLSWKAFSPKQGLQTVVHIPAAAWAQASAGSNKKTVLQPLRITKYPRDEVE
jgi:hypothetical protein